MIRLVIYDFDGTLADTLKLHLRAYEYSLGRFKINVPEHQIIEKCFNKVDAEVARNFNIKDVDAFSKYYREGLLKAFEDISLYPKVISTLEVLKSRNINLGIGTARNRQEMDFVLNKLNIRHYFDVIITHDEVVKKKPDPEIFLEICRQYKVNPLETLIVGDSVNDLIAAKRMAAQSVLFYPSEHKNYYDLKTLQKIQPSYIINNHIQIIDIIKN